MAGVKKTLFQKLQNVKSKMCAGKATATDLTAAAKAYVTDAVAKGNKTKAEAEASVTRVKESGCPIAGAKRRRTTATAKPKAARRRRA